MDFFERPAQSRLRVLIHCLIISGTLNIALMTTLVTFAFKNQLDVNSAPQLNPYLRKIGRTNQAILHTFRRLSYEELLKELDDDSDLGEGLRRCDLALGCLGTYHYFDVNRALSGHPVNKRAIRLDSGETIFLFFGLSSGKFEAIRKFAKTEVWPLTPEGLFREIQGRKEIPVSLKEAFEGTMECFVVQSAFRRLPYPISQETLFSLFAQASWEDIQRLINQIQTNPQGRFDNFPSFLISQMEKGSRFSAALLLFLEKEGCLKTLSHSEVERILTILSERILEIEPFLLSMKNRVGWIDLSSSRTHFDSTGEGRFHIVEPGDSLWRISRRYSVPIETIRTMNQLESDRLQLGIKLLLPLHSTDPNGIDHDRLPSLEFK